MSTNTRHDDAGEARRHATTRLGELLVRSAAGDTTAFAALYAETAPRVFGLALRVVGDHDHAQEVTQEAYLKLWHTAARFDPNKGSCQSWTFMIVHRLAVDRVRSVQAQTTRDDRQFRQAAALDRSIGDPTHELAQAAIVATAARAAVARLSPVQQEALALAYFDGHTYREVAERLGVPLSTAKTRIRDGLTQLRAAMSAQQGLPG